MNSWMPNIKRANPETISYPLPDKNVEKAFQIEKGEKRMIKKTKSGYKVVSEDNKNLGGPYKTREQAEKRLRAVEYFKHKKGKG